MQKELEVRNALIDLQTAFDVLEIRQRSAELARTRSDMARERYALAALDFTSLQQIVQQTANVERSVIDAETGFANALVTLEQQVGRRVLAEEFGWRVEAVRDSSTGY
jgi:outer membrane protein TolC